VQQRIQAIYERDSVVIHPPVDTDRFTPDPSVPVGDYFLIVSRLIPYKRIDLAVAAFARLPAEKLIVVGEGRDLTALRTSAPPNVTFLGRQPWDRLVALMRGCKAFLFPGLEDFGIAPVEAMSAGRPVIAFAGGGALDTVIPGVSGERFAAQTVDALHTVLANFEPQRYDPQACRTQAERFGRERFRRKLLDYLADVMSKEQ
jgi:glycosyltransferase involved in cell wall biosynthesis